MDGDLTGFIVSIILIGSISLLVWYFKRKKEIDLFNTLSTTLFSIKMPRYDKKDGEKDIKQMIATMEQVFSNFLYLREKDTIKSIFADPPSITFEIASEVGGSDISFYVCVPNHLQEAIEKYIQGVYPGAVIEKVANDYTIFEPNSCVSASYLMLDRSDLMPLNTYGELAVDPMASITNALSKIEPEEGSAIQIVIRPSFSNLKDVGDKVISGMSNPVNPNKYNFNKKGVSGILSTAQRQIKEKREELADTPFINNEVQAAIIDTASIEAVRKKISKPSLLVNIRLVAVGKTKERSEQILHNLESSFSQFHSTHNKFRILEQKSKWDLKKMAYNFSFRVFDKYKSINLNLEELSSVFHFPLSHIQSPNLNWSKTREVAPPNDLPNSGPIIVGNSEYRGDSQSVFFANDADRRRHMYIVGQTGTGKSSLLHEMICQDIANGKGVGVIDPHGDLIEGILANIPKSRIDDVVIFEPFDTESPMGLNMLEWKTTDQKDFAVSEMIMIFSKLFPPEVVGPMFEHYMRNAMLALMADKSNPGTLVEISRMFTDEKFMEEKLKNVTDPMVRSFWLREWKQTTGQSKSDMLGYVVSKVGRFVENATMRNIIGQGKSGFDLGEIMDSKKIFLANLSKGRTGEMNSSLLGLILISKIQIAAMQRAKINEEDRKDFYLYIDEFHNFTTDSISTILSEARKYKLNLVLAHQYIPQLSEGIKDAVLGNVGTVASFRIGSEDADILENQFAPDFDAFDLSNLHNFRFVLKMMINGETSSPFKVSTIRPRKGNKLIVNPIKNISKLKYAKKKREVEMELNKRWSL